MKKSDLIQAIPLWILAILVSFVVIRSTISDKELIDLKESYIQEAELKYLQAKANLVDEVDGFIHKKAPSSNLSGLAVVNACDKYGNDIKFVLAQGFKESHYGTAGLAYRTNSVWNVGAYDGLDSNGIQKKFKYDHPNQSIEPYLQLLNNKYLVDKIELDLLTPGGFIDKGGYRYASSETYESSLLSIYEEITKSTKIDSLQLAIKYWKLRCGR